MKKVFALFALCFVIILLLMSNQTGALPENTGAPGELTCGRVPCHNIPANIGNAQIAIQTTDGSTAYFADSTLELKVLIENAPTSKNGFQILALTENNSNAGQWVLAEPTKMKIINGIGLPNRFYVTHTEAGNRQTAWTLRWKAPNANLGKVTFYASVLASNDSGTNQGDQLYTTNLMLPFVAVTALQPLQYEKLFELYPTVARDVIFIETAVLDTPVTAALINSGGLVRHWKIIQAGSQALDISGLPKGIYFLRLNYESVLITKRFIIQ